MKKRILFTCLAVILLFSGCAGSRSSGQELTFMVPRNWAELDSTPALEETIREIERIVRANPHMGEVNEFSIDFAGSRRADLTITWLAINRTGRSIENISFAIMFTRGELYSIPIELTEAFIGIIPDQTATVFTLSFPNEDAFDYLLSLLGDTEGGTANMSLDNVSIEFADE